ncbi:hypothetical protein [Jiangella sp. DSM 45060]|uniref:hypothetical protein n=1 Tax=Jiangella sp. DSM 45060 TaxID=1798224 RepID=UPI00087B083B|nr:hypothetical protein [Jiangella sp. DSM 45060]SDS10261.1 hypothetical protein SAMN04515669_0337 [Jiangella sp. DSM 45060]
MTSTDPSLVDLGDLVLAISADHTFLHVGTVEAMLAHLPGGHDDHPDERVVELYDAAGRRLWPVVTAELVVTGFVPGAGPGDPDAVAARVATALELAQQRLTADPDLGRQQSLPTATEVPRPKGSLADVLGALNDELDVRPGPGHRAGWFHNLFHV